MPLRARNECLYSNVRLVLDGNPVSTLSILLTRRNEELDDKAVIRRLKQRITELEKEVIMLREGTAPEQQVCVSIWF